MFKSICHQIFNHSICVIEFFQSSNLMTKRSPKIFSHPSWQLKVIENWQLKFLSIVGKKIRTMTKMFWATTKKIQLLD